MDKDGENSVCWNLCVKFKHLDLLQIPQMVVPFRNGILQDKSIFSPESNSIVLHFE